jgi:putative Mg2+ transporter-C (MgtC) family protein
MAADIALQIELIIRLVGAAVMGAAIGLEREHHGHPAGTRTHLLVALGSAVFTELSIYGFTSTSSTPVDPTRIAAQIVTGIGFLGAGAILKYGASIRGLTTAASLWCAAAVGMAAGTGAWILAIAGSVIVIFSLGPVGWMTGRVGLAEREADIRLSLVDLDALGPVSRELVARRVEVLQLGTKKAEDRYDVELHLRLPTQLVRQELLAALEHLDGVEVIEAEAQIHG